MDDDQDDEAHDQGDDETDRTLFIPPPQHNIPPPGFAGGSRDRGGANGGNELGAHVDSPVDSKSDLVGLSQPGASWAEPRPDDPPAAWAGGTPPRRTHSPSSTKATLDEEPSASGEGVADLSSIRGLTIGHGIPIRT